MDHTATLAYTTLFAPLVASALIAFFSLRNKPLATFLAWAGIGTGLVCSILMATHALGHGDTAFREMSEIVWLEAGGITLKFGVLIDPLSVLMSLVVTGVGLAIFVFSKGYMEAEASYPRYFSCLSLFAFSMLGIVFSTNLVQTFIFWELVGVSSYSLIGYYFHKPSAVEASKKAFLTNRIGDFGMTCGILLVFFTLATSGVKDVSPSFTFTEISAHFHSGALDAQKGPLALGAFLVFTGALAKSAQFPLHVWLPDAMEGPTPVSALMHAATMVAAGVYLVCRTFFLFAPYAGTLHVIAVIGAITAFLAASMAFVQTDCKKVLAYSTLSQLGYMVLALGLGNPVAAFFHLATHACFKALLFLCAGSAIHGCHHEQDMRWMGGLRKKMPITAGCYAVGALCLAGAPLLSGFWSKDAILGSAWDHDKLLFVPALLVAFMTACYMTRAWYLTFAGEYRGPRPAELREPEPVANYPVDPMHAHAHGGHEDHAHGGHGHDAHGHAHGDHGRDAHGHGAHGHGHGAHGHDDHHHGGEPHESPAVMTFPLMYLAALSVLAGLLNLPPDIVGHGLGGKLEHWLVGSQSAPSWFPGVPAEHFHWHVAGMGTAAAVLGWWIARNFYGTKSWDVEAFAGRWRGVHTLLLKRYYVDDVYLWIVANVQQGIAHACNFVEQWILKGLLADGSARVTQWFGAQVRLPLDGHLHSYVTVALAGVLFTAVVLLVM